MSRVRIFQSLVAVSLLLYLAWSIVPFNWIGPENAKLLSFDSYGAILDPHGRLLTIGMFSLWLFAKVGIFFFQNWGRYLYLGLAVWSVIGVALFGIQIASPLDSMFGSAINLLDGAILAMAYLPATRDLFGSKPTGN
jgi:hypothetical protein